MAIVIRYTKTPAWTLPLLCLSLMACTKYSEYEVIIQNNSDQNISVLQADLTAVGEFDEIILEPNSLLVFAASANEPDDNEPHPPAQDRLDGLLIVLDTDTSQR